MGTLADLARENEEFAVAVAEEFNKLRAEAVINVFDYGAVGDGVADDSGAIADAIRAAQAVGGVVFIPRGVFNHTHTMQIVPTADIDIWISRAALIKADPSLAGKLWWFNAHTDTTKYRVAVRGGVFDGSELPGRVGFSDDLLYMSGYLRDCIVSESVFWFSNHYSETANIGSSGIFSTADGMTVEKCAFYGTVDTAIYLSRDPARIDTKGARVRGNTFIGCHAAATMKRVGRFFHFTDNYVELCGQGVFTGEADAGPTILPGKHTVLTGNTLYRCVEAFSVRLSSGDVVANNHIIDFGYQRDGTTTQTNATAIAIQGCSDAVISANTIEMVDLAPFNTQRAVWIRTVTYNSTAYDSVRTLITGNVIRNVRVFVEEQNSSNDYTRVVGNMVSGGTTLFIRNGANSSLHHLSLTNHSFEIDEESVSLAGRRGAEALRAVRVADQVNWLQVSGSAAGSGTGPVISATGADTNVSMAFTVKGLAAYLFGVGAEEAARIVKVANMVNGVTLTGSASGAPVDYGARGLDANIDVRLLPKGSGLPRFGVFTSNADAAVNGYITIKDSAGNTRKLATIA